MDIYATRGNEVAGRGVKKPKHYLIDIRFRAHHASDQRLDEPRHVGHDIHSIQPLAQPGHKLRAHRLPPFRLPAPREFRRARFRPLGFGVLFGVHQDRRVPRRPRTHDFPFPDDAPDRHDRGAIRRRGRELHHHGREGGPLEIGKGPLGGRVVGFHALQRVDEDASTLEIDGAVVLGDDAAFDAAARPEDVAHGAPGVVRVGAEVGCAVGAGLEARRGAGDGEVDDAGGVGGGFDGVGRYGFVGGDGAGVGVEGEVVGGEVGVVEGVGGPEWGFGVAGGVEDFGVELAGCADAAGSRDGDEYGGYAGLMEEGGGLRGRVRSRYVAVDCLGHTDVAAISHQVKGLRFHACGLHGEPFQMVGLDFGVGCCFGLFGD